MGTVASSERIRGRAQDQAAKPGAEGHYGVLRGPNTEVTSSVSKLRHLDELGVA